MAENKLILEKSPYLLQHAHNPVFWYPWGEEAFAKAKQEQKPVFLSIGYSTCHWCHVMERESFEDTEVAACLNRSFIAIKVDREERPDVDAVYMEVCQSMTGSGGWPLTVIITPEQTPFWVGTYLPKHARYGQPGLMEVLETVAQLWQKDRTRLLEIGETVREHLSKPSETADVSWTPALLHLAREQYRQSWDAQNGGFGPPPKFPTPHNLLFLLQYAQQNQDGQARQMVEVTLTQMARGGIYDQVGGGFSRYSTDAQWLVPHFEKMLYDNALLAYAYLEAYQVTQNVWYRSIAEGTLSYLLRELHDPQGGFYCGQDADSEGVEGKYYVFTPQEIRQVLGDQTGALFCDWFGITERGNFEGKNIPNLLNNPQYAHPSEEIKAACRQLFHYRSTRTVLHKDDKVLTSWNGLCMAALAKAGRVLGEPHYREEAERTWAFLQTQLETAEGRLSLRWREGQAAHQGQLDDYAFLTWALLELYATCFEARYLQKALAYAAQMETLFWDTEQGGFYRTARDAQPLLTRPKETYDGAMPSGNSVAAWGLVRLAALTGEPHWQQLADQQLDYLASVMQGYPAGFSFALLAMGERASSSRELVCVVQGEKPPQELGAFCERFGIHALLKTRNNAEQLAKIAPFTASYPIPTQGEAYYLCQNGACQAPVFSLRALETMLSAR